MAQSLCNEIWNSCSLIPLSIMSWSIGCQATWCNPFGISQTVLTLAWGRHLASSGSGASVYKILRQGKVLCLSVVKCCINSKYWIAKDQSLNVQIQRWLPDENEQIAKILLHSPGSELWIALSLLRCSKTGKEIFPKPIKVISYSQTAVSLSQVSGLGKQLFI